MRVVFVIAVVSAIVCASDEIARAQVDAGTAGTTGSLPNGATLQFRRLMLHEVDNPATEENGIPGIGSATPYQTPQSLWTYFNYAHCVCDEPGDSYGDLNERGTAYGAGNGANRRQQDYLTGGSNYVQPKDFSGYEELFAYEIAYIAGTATNNALTMQVWTGDNMCTNTLEIDTHCTPLPQDNIIGLDTTFARGTQFPNIHAYDLMMPDQASRNPNALTPPQNAQCVQRVFSANEWLIVDTQNDNTNDYLQNQAINTDSLPPPIPQFIHAIPAENAIELSWTAPIGNTGDIYAYQALCLADDNTPVHTKPPNGPYYMTPRTLCGVTDRDIPYATADGTNSGLVSGGIIPSTDAGVPDAPLIDAAVDAGSGAVIVDAGPINVGIPDRIGQSDPALVCATTTNSTATSLRIENLVNGQHYRVALMVIDEYGNAQGIFYQEDPSHPLIPAEVIDIWQDLHDRGSKVDGGFCLISETFGDDSGITNALRGFRDDNLAHSAIGRWLIDAYYGSLGKLGVYVHGSSALRMVSVAVLAPTIAVALLWHWLTLPGLVFVFAGFWLLSRNRRRILRARAVRLATAGAGATLVAVAMPHIAHAQPVPNWDGSDSEPQAQPSEPPTTEPTTTEKQSQQRGYEPEDTREPIQSNSEFEEVELEQEGPPRPNWVGGLKIGPYVPQIDAQLGTRAGVEGPYAEMFGTGLAMMPQADFDRVLWRNDWGMIGVGLTVGYLSRKAHAYLENSSPTMNGNRPISEGDLNTFRLLPVAVLASYRFTYLADVVGVPIVPYVRAGLSYYVWWMNGPSGDIAQVCQNGGNEPMCTQNRALGASAGFQASIGFQVFAEQIDKTAAKAMRDSGLDHAGFYAELNYADVDGFGNPTKLSVGDTTWFAGITFEF